MNLVRPALALALAALALASCARHPDTPGAAPADSARAAHDAFAREAAAAAYDSVAVGEATRRVALPLGGADSLVLERSRGGRVDWQPRVLRADGADALEGVPGALVAAGSVDLHHDGTRDAVWVLESGGTGMLIRELHLYCARAKQPLEMTLTFMRDWTQMVPGVVRSDEAEQPAFALEAAFLERLARAHGLVTEADLLAREHEPRYAYWFWAHDNGALPEGAAMKVRRFPGPPVTTGSELDSVVVGGIVYIAYFKAGVVACDRARDEHWVVFHPKDAYGWPTKLALAGDDLVIGTHGEGLALVRLSDHTLRHLEIPGQGSVETIAVKDSTLVVNGVATVALPRR